jgi:TM2 domain-containing membrane protein YozV
MNSLTANNDNSLMIDDIKPIEHKDLTDTTKSIISDKKTSSSIDLFANKSNNKKETKKDDPCDLIITREGAMINCKIKEILPSEVKYIKCSSSDSPLITIEKSRILRIKYANGEEEIFSEKETSKSNDSSNANQWVALILCFLGGWLGLHRFYLGHIGVGVLYLLTGGLCGIGWFIDFILICTGTLKPKNGEYSEKF